MPSKFFFLSTLTRVVFRNLLFVYWLWRGRNADFFKDSFLSSAFDWGGGVLHEGWSRLKLVLTEHTELFMHFFKFESSWNGHAFFRYIISKQYAICDKIHYTNADVHNVWIVRQRIASWTANSAFHQILEWLQPLHYITLSLSSRHECCPMNKCWKRTTFYDCVGNVWSLECTSVVKCLQFMNHSRQHRRQ